MAEAAKSRSEAPALPTWPDEIYRVLKDAGIRQVAMVPDAGHSRLIRSFEADPETRVVTLTEEEGVAMLAGAWLGGERGVLLLQSSGVGDCINMLSLPVICHMPLLMIVTMRGDWGEFNPWQIPMGQGTRPSLEAMGVIVNKVDDPDTSPPPCRVRRILPSTPGSQSRSCSDSACSAPRTSRSWPANDQSERTAASPRRRQRTRARPCRSPRHCRPRRAELGRLRRRRSCQQFPALGRDGRRLDDGLGLALAQPKRKVLVITGDGEMLMNVGSLASIAVEAPKI